MLKLELISPANVSHFKTVRLAALLDSPSAFGSTYAKEIELSDADWLKRAGEWTSEKSVGYLAMDGAATCGIVAAFLNRDNPHKASLISMWVARTHRQTGIGRALIDAIHAWATGRGVRTLQLMVTSSNHGAIEFYKRNGFTITGRTEAYPNDPALVEYEMVRMISPGLSNH